jgi:predicted phosphoribosyltransferase/pimeloyl-ACP methyl ester carboxylesterase
MAQPAVPLTSRPVQIPAGEFNLYGDLTIPENCRGLIIFAHGSGSSRHSPRNHSVAASLNHERFATLLMDLLTVPEERTDAVTAEFRFDVPLLSSRVVAAVDWARNDGRTAALPIALFGASTGAGATLVAAAQRPAAIRAIVSRGGRPDLAGNMLAGVAAPVLLIVGALDDVVIELNRRAAGQLQVPNQLVIVPDAGHLFEEPGALEAVERLAAEWFARYLEDQHDRRTGPEPTSVDPLPFDDRPSAGRWLAAHLRQYADRADVLVLALPRGGVPVAFEVASALRAPMDVFLVRKLGVPGQEEYAMGAVATGGVRVVNLDVVRGLGLSDAVVERVAAAAIVELNRRQRLYRGDRPEPDPRGRTVILVDDGLATGSTMTAAVRALRAQGPARVVIAVPVAARDSCEALEREVDEIICAAMPEPFSAVGLWYRNFGQTTDEEVRGLLARSVEGAA